jgi:hypothetical protein
MESLFELDSLGPRLSTYVERSKILKPEATRLLEEALVRGQFERGESADYRAARSLGAAHPRRCPRSGIAWLGDPKGTSVVTISDQGARYPLSAPFSRNISVGKIANGSVGAVRGAQFDGRPSRHERLWNVVCTH